MKDECLIIAGGKENFIKLLFPQGMEKVYVIACDKGCEYAQKQGVSVDFACGDFDSASQDTLEFMKQNFKTDILPSHKDDTDLIYGIKHALARNFNKITITCAGGGRYDHFISNIQALVFAKENSSEKCFISLLDDENEIVVVKNETIVIPKRNGWSLSVLSHSDFAEGVSITGAEYEVQNAVFTSSFPLGQSNEWKEDCITISVEKGILLVIMSKVFL